MGGEEVKLPEKLGGMGGTGRWSGMLEGTQLQEVNAGSVWHEDDLK
jgi:hypothetical protein